MLIAVFFLGLIFDLIAGGSLGMTSLKFLVGAGAVYLIKEYWPLKTKQQLSLKL